ncbi:MAG TPA: hypothetical protein VLN47_03590 [Clostridiaceae bacterium]|nr:hypothetical protein [Clostridiaceae bacterium]
MEWIVTAGILGFVAYRFTRMGKGGCCGGHGSHGASHGGHAGTNSAKDGNHSMIHNADTAIDPVCGMEVSTKDAVSRIVNGETFYFCCGGCAKKFVG